MVERLPAEKVRSILDARDHSLRAGLDLLQWASQARSRPAVAPDPDVILPSQSHLRPLPGEESEPPAPTAGHMSF
jgi:hypothetical protein